MGIGGAGFPFFPFFLMAAHLPSAAVVGVFLLELPAVHRAVDTRRASGRLAGHRVSRPVDRRGRGHLRPLDLDRRRDAPEGCERAGIRLRRVVTDVPVDRRRSRGAEVLLARALLLDVVLHDLSPIQRARGYGPRRPAPDASLSVQGASTSPPPYPRSPTDSPRT